MFAVEQQVEELAARIGNVADTIFILCLSACGIVYRIVNTGNSSWALLTANDSVFSMEIGLNMPIGNQRRWHLVFAIGIVYMALTGAGTWGCSIHRESQAPEASVNNVVGKTEASCNTDHHFIGADWGLSLCLPDQYCFHPFLTTHPTGNYELGYLNIGPLPDWPMSGGFRFTVMPVPKESKDDLLQRLRKLAENRCPEGQLCMALEQADAITSHKVGAHDVISYLHHKPVMACPAKVYELPGRKYNYRFSYGLCGQDQKWQQEAWIYLEAVIQSAAFFDN